MHREKRGSEHQCHSPNYCVVGVVAVAAVVAASLA